MPKRKRLKIAIIALLSAIYLVSLVNASSEMTFIFVVKNENGMIYADDLQLFNSVFSELSNKNEGSYRADLVDNKNNILFSVKFNLGLGVLPTPPAECINQTTGEVICELPSLERDSSYVTINLPYFKNANDIGVYKNDKLLFSYEIPVAEKFNYLILLVPVVIIALFILFLLVAKTRPSQPLS